MLEYSCLSVCLWREEPTMSPRPNRKRKFYCDHCHSSSDRNSITQTWLKHNSFNSGGELGRAGGAHHFQKWALSEGMGHCLTTFDSPKQFSIIVYVTLILFWHSKFHKTTFPGSSPNPLFDSCLHPCFISDVPHLLKTNCRECLGQLEGSRTMSSFGLLIIVCVKKWSTVRKLEPDKNTRKPDLLFLKLMTEDSYV